MRASLPMLLAVLAGCAPAAGWPPGGPAPVGETVVEVQNLSSRTVVVYVVTSSGRVPLGAVPALGARRFILQSSLVAMGQNLLLVAGPRGHEPAISSLPFFVHQGQMVRWVLRPGVVVSDVMIR